MICPLEEVIGTAIVKRGRTFQSFTPEGERILVSAQCMLPDQEVLLQDPGSGIRKLQL